MFEETWLSSRVLSTATVGGSALVVKFIFSVNGCVYSFTVQSSLSSEIRSRPAYLLQLLGALLQVHDEYLYESYTSSHDQAGHMTRCWNLIFWFGHEVVEFKAFESLQVDVFSLAHEMVE